MTPNSIKADKGTETYNKKSGKTIKRDSGKREIKPSIELSSKPSAPKIIKSKREKELWARLIEHQADGVFTSLDESNMASFVVLVAEWEKIKDEISNPEIDDSARDRKRRLLSSFAVSIQSLGSNLGLDPISRGKIAAPPDQTKAAIDAKTWGMA